MKKYEISSVRAAETKDIDVSQFFDVDEKVIITIRRLKAKQRNEITSMMLEGQKANVKNIGGEITKDEIEVEVTDASWFARIRTKELLYAVVQNDNFPFERWNEQIIDEIDERNPDFIQFLQNEVQAFNRPLAQRKSKK